MCEFVSWIEIKRDGSPLVLFLTDSDVYSKFGKERLEGSQHNDFLGHGAIRAFFGLKPNEGKEGEARDFWRKNLLPKQIAQRLKNFDSNWGQMFSSGVFQNDDLRYIICNAPDAWRSKASEQLLKQSPTNYDLRCIICNAPDA